MFGRGDQHKVLTDIMGMEDYLGDMDFKLAATRFDYKVHAQRMLIFKFLDVGRNEVRIVLFKKKKKFFRAAFKSLSCLFVIWKLSQAYEYLGNKAVGWQKSFRL